MEYRFFVRLWGMWELILDSPTYNEFFRNRRILCLYGGRWNRSHHLNFPEANNRECFWYEFVRWETKFETRISRLLTRTDFTNYVFTMLLLTIDFIYVSLSINLNETRWQFLGFAHFSQRTLVHINWLTLFSLAFVCLVSLDLSAHNAKMR